jgi:predicted nucleic-acid-binding Zn-ribbon protein
MYYVEIIKNKDVIVNNINDELYWKCKVTGIGKVTGAAITNENKLVVTGEGKSKIYDLDTKKLLNTFNNK